VDPRDEKCYRNLNLEIKITVILPVVFGCETCSGCVETGC